MLGKVREHDDNAVSELSFQVLCVACGIRIREKASEDSYGLCLRCFYADLAKRLSSQPRVSPGEFVSER